MNVTIIQCYAPTSQYDEDDIEAFYEDTSKLMNKYRQDRLIIYCHHDVAGVDPDGRLTLEVTKLNSRQQLKIATWNVRTFHVAINRFNSSGEMEVLESELRRYNINVTGLAETKWKGKEGHYYTTEGNMVIHAENNVRECGVGFIVDNTSSKAVIGYESVSNGVMASSVFTDECDNNTMLCPNVSV